MDWRGDKTWKMIYCSMSESCSMRSGRQEATVSKNERKNSKSTTRSSKHQRRPEILGSDARTYNARQAGTRAELQETRPSKSKTVREIDVMGQDYFCIPHDRADVGHVLHRGEKHANCQTKTQ